MKKLPLCESSGCVAKIKKCTDTCLASHGCPDELHDYQEAFHNACNEPSRRIAIGGIHPPTYDTPPQRIELTIEPVTDFKWSEHAIKEITDVAFRRSLDKRLSRPNLGNGINVPIETGFSMSADPVSRSVTMSVIAQARAANQSCARIVHDEIFNDKPSVEVDATNHIFQTKAATNSTCLTCNNSGIVDGEFDGALECACKKGTNQ